MKVLCHFENIERKVSRLRSAVEDLRRGVLLLDAELAAIEKFDQQANLTNSANPIEARTISTRRENLVKTILILQGKLNELELAQFTQSVSERRTLPNKTELAHYE